MTRLRVASLNMSGAQGPGEFARFSHRCRAFAESENVDVILGQEHNLDPERRGELERLAESRGFGMVIGFAPRGADGAHRGGTLIMIRLTSVDWPALREQREACVVHREPGAVVVRVEWHGRAVLIGSIYAPAKPGPRVDFFRNLRTWITPDMILGGDWNCVPDVTLDVQSSDPTRYANTGASLLGEIMADANLWDFRRTQLVHGREPTRWPLGEVHTNDGPDVVVTRLDRFYIPTNDAHEDLLPSFHLRWDLIWKKETRDHAAIILDLEDAVGEAGHQRHTIREDLADEHAVQQTITKLVEEAYEKEGKEWQKWERAENAIKDYLLKETARRRVKERREITEIKTELHVLSRFVARRGPSIQAVQTRTRLTEKLFELQNPETKGEESLKRQVASAQLSDVSTKRFFRTYKSAAKSQWINSIRKADWVDGVEPDFQGRTTAPKDVPEELAKFWRMIYSLKATDEDAANDLLLGIPDEDGVRRGGMCDRALSQPSVDIMEADITDAEVQQVMEHLPLGKSAGPNRIPNGVYKRLPSLFAPKLGAVLREAATAGTLPPSFLEGDITLLYKKDERDDPRHYRPITLLQNAYKIFTRILATRMKQVVHEFINESQKGFVPHAFIAECSMLMNAVEAYLNDEEHEERGGMMVFLDMEKAFDRVSYKFLLDAAKAVGFGPRFLRTVGMMYNTHNPPQRRVYANGYYSKQFPIQSGVAQGCPLSPLLFLLVAQSLRVAFMQNNDFKGIKIGDKHIRISQFADDTTLFLRGPRDMQPMQESLDKWCNATAMRENIKKREGLAMGRYRYRRRLPPSVKWVKEGEFAIVLGSPVGNDVNHEGWWKKKLAATQGRAQRFIGLFRASYFGRNLIVQAKYFGALRYWLYSIPMSKFICHEVKHDADTLWWSRAPDLGAPRTRFRRFVARLTAIGPKNRGGLNNMDWSGHVQAVLSEWILRWIMPPNRDVCAWKHVLYHMILVDKRGYDKFPEGREIFFCKMTKADKLRLMRGVPKRATYIRSCVYAFWSLGLKQDLDDMRNLRAESFWHNPRFTLDAAYVYPNTSSAKIGARRRREQLSYGTLLDLQNLGDVVDSATHERRTRDNWRAWITHLYHAHNKKPPNQAFVNREAARLLQLADQVPQPLIDEMRRQALIDFEPKEHELVALVPPNDQDCDEEPVFAIHRSGQHHEVRLDAYYVAHRTGQTLNVNDRRIMPVALWHTRSGDRVRGAAEAVFPRTEGWLLDGVQVKLDRLPTSKVTKSLALKKFVPPASEEAWRTRVQTTLLWEEAWKIRSIFATPRDQLTWLKLQHRTLYTLGHDTSTDGMCRACTEKENQLHLIQCDVIRAEFWSPVMNLLERLDMYPPESIEAFLITGQLTPTSIADPAYTDVVCISWRCLYAAIVESRLENSALKLQAAYDRMVSMVHGRVRAYGEKWRMWVEAGRNFKKPRGIAQKHLEKILLTFHDDGQGGYDLHPTITGEAERVKQPIAERADPPPRGAPPPTQPRRTNTPRTRARTPAPTAPQVAPAATSTVMVRGDAQRLDDIINITGLPAHRLSNLTAIRNSMDATGTIKLQVCRPNTTGGVVGGRTTYKDVNGVGNALLSCHAGVRAFVFGQYWDEIDITRSHIKMVFGCWELTTRRKPTSMLRYLTEPDHLEADIAAQLSSARDGLRAELNRMVRLGGANPSQSQRKQILYARKAAEKCDLPPKKVMSAMINVKSPAAWRIPFGTPPGGIVPTRPSCLMQLLDDILMMRRSVLEHPLCTQFAAALTHAGVPEPRAVSLCMGHLDDCALSAARACLHRAGISTSVTINDSLYVGREQSAADVAALASDAATNTLKFDVRFTFLPRLVKEGEPQPTALSLAADLGGDAPDHAPIDAPTSGSEGEADEFGAAPLQVNHAAPAHAPQATNTDPLRDMSGDAITFQQAQRMGCHAQCALATVRNVRRYPDYTKDRLAERCLTADYPGDIRYPDWPILLSPLVNQGEVIKRATLATVPAAQLSDFRLAVAWTGTHVVAVFNDDDGAFRVYDNDSDERLLGTFATMRADEIIDAYIGICGVLQEGSDLSARIGPAITTFHQRRERQRPNPGTQPRPNEQPPRTRQNTLQGWLAQG